MATHYSTRIIYDSLVLHLDPGNPKSYVGTGTTIMDMSKSKNHCTFKGGVGFSAESGGVLLTDGTDDYIESPRISGTGTPSNDLTWCIWVNPLADAGNIMSMSSGNPQSSWNMPPLAASSSSFRGKVWSNNILDSSYTIGNWYYLCLVWNYDATLANRYQRLYVNGILAEEQTSISYSASNTDNFLYFGQQNPGANNTGMFEGKYGQIQVYSGKALTESEIRQNFQATRGRYGI